MSDTQPPPNPQDSVLNEDQAEMHYTLNVRTNMPPRWDEWFEGMDVKAMDNQEFILSGMVPDQAALHGLIARIRDLNLVLIQVKKTAPGQNGP